MMILKMSATNCYLVDTGSGYLQIDTGYEKDREIYLEELKKNKITLNDISYVLLTHAHDDHCGLLNWITAENPKISVISNEPSKQILLQGHNDVRAPGYNPNRVVNMMMKILYKIDKTWTFRFPPYQMRDNDIIVVNNGIGCDELTLKKIGIDGIIYFTPGHTVGHMSVILRNNIAITGDSVSNMLSWAGTKNVPLYFEDIDQLYKEWKVMLDQGASSFFPGHGNPVDKECLIANLYALRNNKFPRQMLMPKD